ncbi:hypothetical protein ABW17_08310 [Mycobacterium nebraskense]|uniref:mycothiol-dependent nitroreductase Rv2466c family protein n=1 Tax=Mycobacterium nebraskense TaxID=244292 RepID=UPI0006420263|nr:hypothetical protein [Mycobacterium nebraskense]KLO44678.1 hypothetical protein ABW17_08310 [Mycobacterium nebraskense]
MGGTPIARPSAVEVTMWFDPVCPFSWNTARWLTDAANKTGFEIDWELMNLAVLNEGRELPPPQRARMGDSRRVGRLMASIHREMGSPGLGAAYLAFGELYFDRFATVDDQLVDHVLGTVGARDTSGAAPSDTSLDEFVRQSHEAGQKALGETGGSPILRIDGRTFFGPVLTTLPAPETSTALFDAVAALAAIPQFTQLQRPRTTPPHPE